MRVTEILSDIQARLAVRAPAMIVTIYGDIVVPRGGVLWMGTLVEICARLGISETLVRTAVSRLVAAGQLVGERDGRRSYYGLAAGAQTEFAAAARLLYGPQSSASGFLIHHAPGVDDETVRRAGLGRMGPDLYLRADHPENAPIPGLTFRAEVVKEVALLSDYAATLWNLQSFADGYRTVIDLFSPLAELLKQGADLPPADAISARLLLVQAYRAVLLRDPRLPDEALPKDWPGHAARRLFSALYREISPLADDYIGAHFEGRDGRLPTRTDEVLTRLRSLEPEAVI
ncbi:PaaX family transcriptional regulator C-terminal domain-containing protein [Ciceribacter sp. RN22]|uniref:PaaX family transcriptional regulator C-terminal domain-containing protein n=1 Tax=Ciceribacter sp. RN22 TaxID=2954932 RepID=UPI002093331F|nr:PaaX family transcriptional regulator C-terminal domain-containing protein [Ciceribacter sp. RN22]MCO6179376.1 PaaX family transcriptional regulator [Ciceribacter sp. RN22]